LALDPICKDIEELQKQLALDQEARLKEIASLPRGKLRQLRRTQADAAFEQFSDACHLVAYLKSAHAMSSSLIRAGC